MELWIPNTVNKKLVEGKISDWLKQSKKHRPYQYSIQERIHSLYPQLHLHQTLYIAEVNEAKLTIKEPKETKEVPYAMELCAICHEEDRVVRHTLPCNHRFHLHCITRWLRNNDTCPMCRMDLKNAF